MYETRVRIRRDTADLSPDSPLAGRTIAAGTTVGRIFRVYPTRLYAGENGSELLFENADCKATAASLLAQREEALGVGDSYRITGIPSATGGPWTIVRDLAAV